MHIKEDWLQWFLSFLIKKSTGSGIKFMLNQQFANELHQPIIIKFEKEGFIFQLLNFRYIRFYFSVRYLLCASDLSSKYA